MYDECPAADMANVCDRIAAFLKRRRFQMGISRPKLHRSLLEYVWMRYTKPASSISSPLSVLKGPAGWDDTKDCIWRQYIAHVCGMDEWESEVMEPVFGECVRFWEERISTGWRLEILEFLPWWIYRDMELFEEIDPTPLPDPEEAVAASKSVIDPYILEHGGRRARLLAERKIAQQ